MANPPGLWLGKGAEQLGVAGGEVTEAQMRALFGQGVHPDAEAMRASGAPAGATKLGAAYPTYPELAPYPQRVADAVEAFATDHGRPPSAAERNQIAANVARRGRRAVAGFDMVFTPVKSASVLWGLGGPQVRAAVEDAHHEAVRSTLAWVQSHAAYTRAGHAGAAQIDATGLVAAALGGTSTTCSPSASSRFAMCMPIPAQLSIAHTRSGHPSGARSTAWLSSREGNAASSATNPSSASPGPDATPGPRRPNESHMTQRGQPK